ncbi:MAG: UvrD-helicase domain-containing protein, partial [Simkania negevensis]|nr:UvrD-helicase domain-containing protein [Simkania negevensis]
MSHFNCLEKEAPLLGHHILEASAGTGKTFALKHLFAQMLLTEEPPLPFLVEEILVVTFTRAATRELKVRIKENLEQLFHLLQSNNPSPFPYIEALRSGGEERKSRALFYLERALAFLDQMQIFTIHGFCQKMLSEYAFEGKIAFLHSHQEQQFSKEVLLQEIRDFLTTSLSPFSYSPSQIALLLKNMGGEIKNLEQKLLTLIEQEGLLPSLPDFSTLLKMFQDALQISPLSPNFLEIIPYFNQMTNREGKLHFEIEKQIKILAASLETKKIDAEQFDLLLEDSPSFLELLAEENLKKRKEPPPPSILLPLHQIRALLLPIIQEGQQPTHTLFRIAAEAREQIKKMKSLEEILTPDDLIKQMAKALQYPPFLKKLQTRYRAALIDEFQDTDPLQWEIFRSLFLDPLSPLPSFYLIGDPKQSIYSFRNADLFTYLKAAEEVKNKAFLDINYRSEPKLLEILNRLFSKETLGEWLSLGDHPLTIEYLPVKKKEGAVSTSFYDKKKPVHFFMGKKEKGKENPFFFHFIAREIHALRKTHAFPFSDFAILVKDRYQGRRLKQFLEKEGIPTQSTAQESIEEAPSFSLFLSLIKLLAFPSDLKELQKLLSHPLFNLSHQELKNETLAPPYLAFFHQLHYLFHKEGLLQVMDQIWNENWIFQKSLSLHLLEKKEIEAFADLRKLSSLLIDQHAATQASPFDLIVFLESLSKEEKEKGKKEQLSHEEGVTISTIHKSKGLEFEIVFALGLASRHIEIDPLVRHKKKWLLYRKSPGFVNKEEGEEWQKALKSQQGEKLRQLYVALTRAKKRLYVPLLLNASDKEKLPLSALSPMELLLSKFSFPLEQTLKQIGASYEEIIKETTSLENQIVSSLPELQPPSSSSFFFPPLFLHSFSSLTTHTSSPSFTKKKLLPTDLPPGIETGHLLHSLLEKIIEEALTFPYQKKEIDFLVESELRFSPLRSFKEQITALLENSFKTPLPSPQGLFTLEEIPPQSLHPEVEFFHPLSSTEMMKGFIDLVFFHQGFYYLLDWKSNLLENYDE